MRILTFCLSWQLTALFLLLVAVTAQAAEWQLQGALQAGFFADTVYRDPYIRAERTPVFGDDGSGALDADNSCVPTGLKPGSVEIEECRDLYLDGPEFGGSFIGSHLKLSFAKDELAANLEAGFYSFTDPYMPELRQLWLERDAMRVGYGLSAFSGPLRSFTLDYGGPIGEAYKRQLGVRMQLTRRLSLAFEDPTHRIYLGLRNRPDHKNSDSVLYSPRTRVADTGEAELIYVYEIDNRLRDRATMPDVILSYDRQETAREFFAALLMQYIRLDNNAPLLLDEDPGLLQLIDDASRIPADSIVSHLDEELRLNEELAGGLYNLNLGVHLGADLPLVADHRIHLAYVLNGGSYLRDNPNPTHLVVPNFYSCHLGEDANCEYSLVNVATHSYLIDFHFANRVNWVLSGVLTDDEYADYLGGAASEQLHSTHLNYRHGLSRDIAAAYEIGYVYHRSFNGRSNADYPRFRFQYRLFYQF